MHPGVLVPIGETVPQGEGQLGMRGRRDDDG